MENIYAHVCVCVCGMFALVSLRSLIFPFIENALWCHVNFAIKVDAIWGIGGDICSRVYNVG